MPRRRSHRTLPAGSDTARRRGPSRGISGRSQGHRAGLTPSMRRRRHASAATTPRHSGAPLANRLSFPAHGRRAQRCRTQMRPAASRESRLPTRQDRKALGFSPARFVRRRIFATGRPRRCRSPPRSFKPSRSRTIPTRSEASVNSIVRHDSRRLSARDAARVRPRALSWIRFQTAPRSRSAGEVPTDRLSVGQISR